MSEAQYNILPQGGQKGQPSESNDSMDLAGTDHELQEQMAQS
jgi:hypothetical protein